MSMAIENPDFSPTLALSRVPYESTPTLHCEIILNDHPLRIYALERPLEVTLTAHVPDWQTQVGEVGHEGDTYLIRKEIPFNQNGQIGTLIARTTRAEPTHLRLVKIERTTDILPPDSAYSNLSGVRLSLLYGLHELAKSRGWNISTHEYLDPTTRQWLIDNQLANLLSTPATPNT